MGYGNCLKKYKFSPNTSNQCHLSKLLKVLSPQLSTYRTRKIGKPYW